MITNELIDSYNEIALEVMNKQVTSSANLNRLHVLITIANRFSGNRVSAFGTAPDRSRSEWP